MADFADKYGDLISVDVWAGRVIVNSVMGAESSFFEFAPATARLIAAALIEAADKAEAQQ